MDLIDFAMFLLLVLFCSIKTRQERAPYQPGEEAGPRKPESQIWPTLQKAMKANMLLLWLISLLATCLHSFHIGKGFTRCSNHRGLSIARRPSTLLPAKNWKHNNVRETDESMRQSAFTRELALAKLRGTVEGFAKNDFEPYSAFVPQDVMNFVNW